LHCCNDRLRFVALRCTRARRTFSFVSSKKENDHEDRIKTGSRVARGLAARGLPVRLGSRSASPPFSWHEPETWVPALAGVSAVYLTYQPDLAMPGAAEVVSELTAVAKKHGAGRVVLLSGRGEPHAVVAEDAIRATGVDLTVIRCSWFCQNFDEGHLLGAVLDGVLALPAAETAEPFIDVEDVADVAVAALLDDAHIGKIHELTGPRLLTFREVAAEIAEASGRPLTYVPISKDEFNAALAQAMPPDEAAFFGELFPFLLDGHNASTTDTVERILGRKPRDFRSYARAAAGAWARRPY
jgi:uncharacterized protein YbjT (DUF2867 family)